MNQEQLLLKAAQSRNAKMSSFETIILTALKAKSEEDVELDYQAGELLKKAYEGAAIRVNLDECYKRAE